MNTLVIAGSSRKNGNTAKIVSALVAATDWDAIDLCDYEINYYDYEHKNRGDDFLPLIRAIIDRYDTLVFATPVYWYSMSGIMKVFFDRISDLLTIEKDLGRRLRGKKMAAISASGGNDLGPAFFLPFRESAKYLGMFYLGDRHMLMQDVAGADLRHQHKDLLRFIEKVNKRESHKPY